MKSEMQAISKKVSKQREFDNDVKQSAAQGLLNLIGSKALNFVVIDGIENEAPDDDEGSIYVRIDNLTFITSAYKGAKQPPLDFNGAALKEMAKVAQQASDKWAIETAGPRKVDGA